ncbi:hypothetical protein EYF80_015129 [Liparis tanakae]|uniref:Uncharacterized protein n=1 Tax=Liparis tanakae TaxID=230148 RepID=A0A4Z2IB09_9TELE|nr:hypothetical protein EYF80_015129 [Liparis tanakae]
MNPSLRTSAVSPNRTDVLVERSVETSHPSLAVALMEQLNPTASTPPRTEDDPTRVREERGPKEVLLGLGDAEAAEGALQLLVIHGRDGHGRVALRGGGVLLTSPVAPPAPGAGLPAADAGAGGGALVDRGGWRREAEQGGRVIAAATDRRGGVGHAAVPGGLAERVLQLVLPGGRGAAVAAVARGAHRYGHVPTQQRIFLFQRPIRLTLLRAVVRRGRIRLLGVEKGIGFRTGDAHALHIHVDQEIQFPVHAEFCREALPRDLKECFGPRFFSVKLQFLPSLPGLASALSSGPGEWAFPLAMGALVGLANTLSFRLAFRLEEGNNHNN